MKEIENENFLNDFEKKLKKFFKCCQFMNQCFYTSDDLSTFIYHLQSKHLNCEIFCVYCYQTHYEWQSTFSSPYELVLHMIYYHPFRIFQCNLCLFRAPSTTHIHFHQANYHGSQYRLTKTKQTTQLKTCKIIVCKQIVFGPFPHYSIFLENFIVNKFKNDSESFHCFYCQFKSQDELLTCFHVCQFHTDECLCILYSNKNELFSAEENFQKVEN